MKVTPSITLSLLLSTIPFVVVKAATCGGGSAGDGICPQQDLCCSKWGWCGTGSAYCQGPQPTPAPVAPNTPAPVAPVVPVSSMDDSRMIAYLGNWQSCPTADQLAQYTHIVVSFAVSYTWQLGKNQCSQTCEIATPPVCNNQANPNLLAQLRAQGKKVLVSFGGAGMGGSWDGLDDCWEYCFGRETQVVNRLSQIVNELNADGVDIDYEYYYENNQNGSAFSKGAQAQNFLKQITVGLRNSLASDAIVTHAPMDVDMMPGKAYFNLLKDISSTLDFLMPQYYNGITRPALDGIDGTGAGSVSALDHFNTIVKDFFGGDATRMVFGFCISDCGATSSNADSSQAANVMQDLSAVHSCNGGAFFWVAEKDTGGSWSSIVNQAITASSTCSSSPQTPAPIPPTNAPTTLSPVTVPTPTASTDSPTTSPTKAPIQPTLPPPSSSSDPCCPSGYTGLRDFDNCKQHYHCVSGVVTGNPMDCPVGTLFDVNLQICNWANQVTCPANS